MKFCPRCGSKNNSGDAVCGSCGQKLYGLLAGAVSQLACAFCATGNPPTAVYCLGCGRRLDETPTSVRAARRKATADALAGVPPPSTAAVTAGQPARTAEVVQSTRHTLGCAAAVAVLVAAAGTAFIFRATIRPVGTPAPIEQDAAIATVSALIDRATPRSAFVGSAGGGSRSTSAQRETEPPAASGSAASASPRATARPAGDASSSPSSETRAAGASATRTGEATTDRSSATGSTDDAAAGRPAGTATGSGPATGARVGGTARASVSTPSGQSDTARTPDASGADRATATAGVAERAAAGDARTDAGDQASSATGSPVAARADSPAASTGTAAATRSPIISVGTVRATPAGTPAATAVVAARSGSIIFTLTRIAVDPVTPVPGHHVLVLTAVIENAGAGLLPYDRGDFRLADGLGTSYQPLPPAVGGLAAGLIQPGRQITGDVVFDVPAGRRDLTLRYEGIALDLSSRLPPT